MPPFTFDLSQDQCQARYSRTQEKYRTSTPNGKRTPGGQTHGCISTQESYSSGDEARDDSLKHLKNDSHLVGVHNNVAKKLTDQDVDRCSTKSSLPACFAVETTSRAKVCKIDKRSCKRLRVLYSTLDLRRYRKGENVPEVAAVLNEIGDYYYRCLQYEQALEAYEQASRCDSSEALATAYCNMGSVHLARRDIAQSTVFLNMALGVNKTTTQRKGQRLQSSLGFADILHQLGLVATFQGSYTVAMEHFEGARKICEKSEEAEDVAVAQNVGAIGRVQCLQGNWDAAIKSHIDALSIQMNADGQGRATVLTLLNITDVYQTQQKLHRAIKVCDNALQRQLARLTRCQADTEIQNFIVAEASEVINILEKMGDLYTLQGHGQDATRYYEEAIKLFESVGLGDDSKLRKGENKLRGLEVRS
jgi:tetratricopeptide (TPR) repeat protein